MLRTGSEGCALRSGRGLSRGPALQIFFPHIVVESSAGLFGFLGGGEREEAAQGFHVHAQWKACRQSAAFLACRHGSEAVLGKKRNPKKHP